MRKAILILLLAVVSNSVMAEWVMLGTNDSGTTTVYADPSTISKNGDMVKMWSMIDFEKAVKLSDGKQFLSWKTQYEFDCKIKQSRMLAVSMHSENMGGGEVTNSLDYESPKGEAVLADSNGEVLWNYACRRGYQSAQDAQKHCPSDTVVWFNFATEVIHYKGQRWYGRTKDGAYVCKNEAVKKSDLNSRIVQ